MIIEFDNLSEAVHMASELHTRNCQALAGKKSWEEADRNNEAVTISEARKELRRAVDIVKMLELVLGRLDLEASSTKGTTLLSAYREDIRKLIQPV